MKWVLVMALNLVSQFFLHAEYDFGFASPFLDNRTVKTFWDDVANQFAVKLYDVNGTLVAEPTTGPTVSTAGNSRGTRLLHLREFGYSYCEGLNLNRFFHNNSSGQSTTQEIRLVFPYARREIINNHFSCEVHVCLIEFDLTYTQITPDSGSGDGSVEVKATTNATDVRFTRNPTATYATATPSVAGVYTFTNLSAGTYTIYAIDEFNCKASIIVVVLSSEALYFTKWRLQYQDLLGRLTRVDIEERRNPIEITNGNFYDTLDPATSEGAGNAWTWTGAFSGAAYNTLPSSLSPTAKLRIPFATTRGVTYRFELAVRGTDGGGGSGDYTDWKLYLTDGIDYSTVVTQANIGLGNEVFIVEVTAVTDQPYIEVTAEANNVAGQDREILLLRIKNITEEEPETITIVKGGANPFVLSWAGLAETNIFTPVIASVATISLISETDFMFLDLFTQDERKYRVKQYKDTGSGLELKWVGFVLPMAYSEPYDTEENYEVTITANDQLGNLKDIDFSDDSGNPFVGTMSCLDAICAILRKTDIHLNVRESVNIFETTMQTDAEDSAIQQAFFDALVYQEKTCEEALQALLVTYGARLYQAEGYWHIELIEQRGSSSIAYREFEITGQYSSNGTLSPVVNIKQATATSRAVLRDRSGIISIMPSYGKLLFRLITNSTNNLLRTGKFEPTDLVNNQFLGWSFDLTNGAGVAFGLETLEKPINDSTTALFIDFTNVNDEREIILLAEEFDLEALNGPTLVFKMDVLFRPHFREIFSYIDISIKIGDRRVNNDYTASSLSTDALVDDEYIRYYIDTALEWKTIEKKIYTTRRQFNVELVGPVNIKIRVGNNPQYDYASITALRAQVTDDNFEIIQNANRVKVLDDTVFRTYTLERGTDADNSPEVIRPDDFNASTNAYVWKLNKSLQIPDENYLLAGVLIDNVVFTLDNSSFPPEIIIEKTINENIKDTFEIDLYHADLVASELASIDVDENSKRAFKSYLRLNSGVPTVLWKRSYEDEQRALLDVVLRMYQGQITRPSFKLSGSFYSDVYPSMFHSFLEARMIKYFIANSLAIQDKMCSFDAELIELRTGAAGEPPTPETYEFTEEFTTEFDA